MLDLLCLRKLLTKSEGKIGHIFDMLLVIILKNRELFM